MSDLSVEGLLAGSGLGHLVPIFRRERIDSEVLLALDDIQLKSLGVEHMGERVRLRTALMSSKDRADTGQAATVQISEEKEEEEVVELVEKRR